MRALVLIVLSVALEASAGWPTPRCRDRACLRGREEPSGRPLAFFEFAPPEGFGMAAPCACAAVTGANGEVMTFTRASSGTCLKGGETTGIANGDMVTCSNNQPRVMPGGDGSGGLGLLIESARTNICLRSQEFDNAAWADQTFGGPAAITITANAAVAPDGTTTAERFQIPAVSAGQYSLRAQSVANGTNIASVFAKGNGQSGTVWVIMAGGGGTSCGPCAYNATTWTRCSNPALANTNTIYIGVDQLSCATSNQGSKDVFIWGAQVEAGVFPSSYIATAGATVTRALEVATLPIGAQTNATGSLAATLVPHSATSPDDRTFVSTSAAGPAYKYTLDYTTAGGQLVAYGASSGGVPIGAALSAGVAVRGAMAWVGVADVTVFVNGLSATGSWGAPNLNTTLAEIGTLSGVAQADGVVKQVCYDPDQTRCR